MNTSEDAPLETVFFFPVELELALSKIQIDYYDPEGKVTTVETVMEERQKAEAKYDDAVAEGNKMAVLGQYVAGKTRSMIKVQMGNFPPKTRAVLTCFMYTALTIEDESTCFRLPLCYIPKYLLQNVQVDEKVNENEG